jgi:hypothetical protein
MSVPLDHTCYALVLANSRTLRNVGGTPFQLDGRLEVDWARVAPELREQLSRREVGKNVPQFLVNAVTACVGERLILFKNSTQLILTINGEVKLARLRESYLRGPTVTYQVSFRTDIRKADNPPKEIVAWEVGRGTRQEIKTWPWTEAGCAQAEQWALEHHAILRTGNLNYDAPVRKGDITSRAQDPQRHRFNQVRASLTNLQRMVFDEVMKVSAGTGHSPADIMTTSMVRRHASFQDGKKIRAALGSIGVKI